MIRAYYTVYTDAPPSSHIFGDFHKPPPLPSPLVEHILFVITGNININTRTAQFFVVNHLGDGYRFRRRRGGISGGCCELKEPALNCEEIS